MRYLITEFLNKMVLSFSWACKSENQEMLVIWLRHPVLLSPSLLKSHPFWISHDGGGLNSTSSGHVVILESPIGHFRGSKTSPKIPNISRPPWTCSDWQGDLSDLRGEVCHTDHLNIWGTEVWNEGMLQLGGRLESMQAREGKGHSLKSPVMFSYLSASG